MLPVTTYTEAELLEALLLRNEQAYAWLYDHYSKALFGIIFQVISRQEVAEDVLQEVFVKIWQNIRSYDPAKGRLYTWMLNIARNSAIDRTRSKEFSNQGKTMELTDNVYTHKEGVEGRVGDVGLKKTLEGLPPDSRRLLELAYFQGYTQEEISRMLQLPLGTVKTRIRTVLLQLRKVIQK